jgi:hypothetical protein
MHNLMAPSAQAALLGGFEAFCVCRNPNTQALWHTVPERALRGKYALVYSRAKTLSSHLLVGRRIQENFHRLPHARHSQNVVIGSSADLV